MKKIMIDKEKCIGCGLCVALAPEVFELREDGKAQIKPDADLESKSLEDAVQSCPVEAIIMEK